MTTFTTIPRKWGNSIGITIPKEVIEAQQIEADKPITVDISQRDMKTFWKAFGTLKLKRSTQEALDEIDREFDKDLPG